MAREVYILAISGGVDSVVLLHKLATFSQSEAPQLLSTNSQLPIYIVAHVDHGIRNDSSQDAAFVEGLAKHYGLAFETTQLALGERTSEQQARTARYDFLFEIMKKYKAEAIVAAHHQDDVVETMIVNMLRGTGPRGLVGFSRPQVLRPFMRKSKQDLLEYAQKHKLQWREDKTNADLSYLRNYIRARIMPKLGQDRQRLLDIRERVEALHAEIDDTAKKLLVQSMKEGEVVRSAFVVLPYIVQLELISAWLRLEGVTYDRNMIERAVLAAKTLQPGKHIELGGNLKLLAHKSTIVLKVHPAHV